MNVRVVAVFFSVLLVLSSGAMQLGVHLCSKAGPSFFSSCETEHHHLPDCCAKKDKKQTENCCTDAYLFAITPKYGNIEKFKLPFPDFLELWNSYTDLTNTQFGQISQVFVPEHSPPKPFNCSIQKEYCIWII
jgi:hypothetical protein